MLSILTGVSLHIFLCSLRLPLFGWKYLSFFSWVLFRSHHCLHVLATPSCALQRDRVSPMFLERSIKHSGGPVRRAVSAAIAILCERSRLIALDLRVSIPLRFLSYSLNN